MGQGIGILISVAFIGVGAAGILRPEFLRGPLEKQYTPARARISALIALLIGLAGLWSILTYAGGPVDFFPA
jgi:hypothetical protein